MVVVVLLFEDDRDVAASALVLMSCGSTTVVGPWPSADDECDSILIKSYVRLLMIAHSLFDVCSVGLLRIPAAAVRCTEKLPLARILTAIVWTIEEIAALAREMIALVFTLVQDSVAMLYVWRSLSTVQRCVFSWQ